MLSISNYRKSYNGHLILDIPQLDLGHGIYWIKGANGSGKSTLFKSICGIIPFHGNCELNGKSVNTNQVAYRKMVSYSEAEPLFPEFLTQKDLITFTHRAKGVDQKQADHILSKLGTTEYYHKPVGTYSSGMLKKTGLAMAFLGDLKLIVLDEPFITIDSQSTKELVSLIKDYYNSGTTFLISSHVTEGGTELPVKQVFHITDNKLVAE